MPTDKNKDKGMIQLAPIKRAREEASTTVFLDSELKTLCQEECSKLGITLKDFIHRGLLLELGNHNSKAARKLAETLK